MLPGIWDTIIGTRLRNKYSKGKTLAKAVFLDMECTFIGQMRMHCFLKILWMVGRESPQEHDLGGLGDYNRRADVRS